VRLRSRVAGLIEVCGLPLAVELRIKQIKLQLDRHHRRKTALSKSIDNAFEHLAWIGRERAALGVLHAEQQLRHGFVLPGHHAQTAGHGPTDTILIADVVAQPGFLDSVAGDIGRDQRHRQAHAIGVYLFQRIAGDALAAQQTIHIRQQKIDHFAAGDLL
jgi:hypothetical protein